MAATDARPVPRKNAAFRFYFAIRKSDGTLITTWVGQDSEVSLDGASFSDCTNEATEIGTSGCGYLDLTASEMNADSVVLKITVTNTGALPLVFTFFPEESGDYRADTVMISGDSVAADNLEAAADGTGYNLGGGSIVVASVTAGVTVGMNNDKTGYSLTSGTGLGNQTANITGNLSGSVGSVTAGVTVTTNNDKTGYSLLATTGLGNQTANITGNISGSVGSVTGGVTVSTNNDKTGYSLLATTGLGNQTANITGNVSGSVGSVVGNVGGNVVGSVASVVGGVTVSTNNDKTGYSLSTAPLDAAGTRAALGLASANLDTQLSTIDLWTKRSAVLNTGTLTGAGTNTEVYTISALGITATCTTDSSGNRSAIVWS